MMRLGIIGTGRIADRLVQTLEKKTPPDMSGAFSVVAVYNKNGDSAERFAKTHNIGLYTDDAEKLFASVDAVYIASPHEIHAEYTRRALEAGKHVLCEKPMALSRQEAEELFSLAADRGLVLMEAMKTAYCPGFLALADCALSGRIGEIVDVEAAFTRLTPTNVRELRDLRYGGSFTEMGSYGLLPVFLLLGYDWESVSFFSRDAANGLDVYTKTIFDYGDRTATVKTGLGVKSEGQLLVSGTKGYILAESPWWMTKKFVVRYEDPTRVEEHVFPYDGSGMQYELAAFLSAVQDKDQGEDITTFYSPVSIASSDIMERFLAVNAEKRAKARECLDAKRTEVKIWAHRGCSMEYPENTLPAFKAAAELSRGLTGVELDVQRTADGRLVVIHDETVDRVTTASGSVKDMTLEQLQALEIKRDENAAFGGDMPRIPSFEEVLTLLEPYCRNNGLKINVELKTSVVRYDGIEQQAYDMVKAHDLTDSIVWSSFLPDSIRIIKEIDPSAETGMLAGELEDCVSVGDAMNCDAYHPWNGGLIYATNERAEVWSRERRTIRAYNGDEPLYGSGKAYKPYDLRDAALFGVTDVFTNVPERYVTDTTAGQRG